MGLGPGTLQGPVGPSSRLSFQAIPQENPQVLGRMSTSVAATLRLELRHSIYFI